MDEQELQEMIRKLQESGDASADFGDKVKEAGKSVSDFSKKTAGELTKSVGTFSSSVIGGAKGFDTLTPIVTSLGNAMAGLAGAIPLVGGAAKAVVNAATSGSKFLLGQLERQRKTFNSVSESGLILDGSLTNFSNTAFGTLMNLEQFGKVVADNGQALSRMRGTAAQGTVAFADLATTLTQDQTVRRLGYSAEELGEITSGFIKQQTRLGQSQNMTTDQLNRSTGQYISELDMLSRLTGQNRKDLQAQQDALQREARFGTMLQRMQTAGQGEQAKAMQDMVVSIAGFSPRMAEGLKDIMTAGTATTEEGRQLMMLSGGALQGILKDLKAKNIDFQTATQRLQKSLGGAEQQFGSIAQIQGNVNPLLADFASIIAFTKASLGDLEEAAKQTADQQNSTDKMMTSMVTASINIDKFAANLNKLILNEGLGMAASLTGVLTQTLESFMAKIPETISTVKQFFNDNWTAEESVLNNTLTLIKAVLVEIKRELVGIGQTAISQLVLGEGGTPEEVRDIFDRIGDATKGGMIGAGTGATAGLFGGPVGVVGGSVIGGILGAVMGYFENDVDSLMSGGRPKTADDINSAVQPMALGGRTMRGQPYLVGERGPELFVPGSMGNIIPNYAGEGRTGLEDIAGPASSKFSQIQSDFSVLATSLTTALPGIANNTANDRSNELELLTTQGQKLDELIRLMGRQVTVSTQTKQALM